MFLINIISVSINKFIVGYLFENKKIVNILSNFPTIATAFWTVWFSIIN
jgi:hypothetical protein